MITQPIRPFEPQSVNSHAVDVLSGISDLWRVRSNLVGIVGRDIAIGRPQHASATTHGHIQCIMSHSAAFATYPCVALNLFCGGHETTKF